jgi:hypothetical protein
MHMAIKAWNVDISGTRHYVELDHGMMSGKRLIKVDDQVVIDEGMSMSWGHSIPFEIEDHPAEIEISTAGFDWDYALKVNNRVVQQL